MQKQDSIRDDATLLDLFERLALEAGRPTFGF